MHGSCGLRYYGQGRVSEGGGGMGYSLFSVGEKVRILSGSFIGIEGIVTSPAHAARTAGTVVLQTDSELSPVTLSAVIDGHSVKLRVPPELLGRI